jgi:hypothetical protein
MIGSAGGSFLTKLRAGGKELSISPTAPICTGEDARAYNCSSADRLDEFSCNGNSPTLSHRTRQGWGTHGVGASLRFGLSLS